MIAVAERGMFGVLRGLVGAQDRDGGAVQGDGTLAAGGLRRAQHQAAIVLLQLGGDDRGRAVQVDVAPAQSGGLAAAQPAQRDQVIGGIQAVVAVQDFVAMRSASMAWERT